MQILLEFVRRICKFSSSSIILDLKIWDYLGHLKHWVWQIPAPGLRIYVEGHQQISRPLLKQVVKKQAGSGSKYNSMGAVVFVFVHLYSVSIYKVRLFDIRLHYTSLGLRWKLWRTYGKRQTLSRPPLSSHFDIWHKFRFQSALHIWTTTSRSRDIWSKTFSEVKKRQFDRCYDLHLLLRLIWSRLAS